MTEALGLSTVNGLPAHVLLVHAVVVLLPLTAVYVVAASLVPSVAVRAGLAGPCLAAVAGISVLLAMNAGDWLERHVPPDPLVHRHTEMAGKLWPFAALLVVLSVVVWARNNRGGRLGVVARLVPAGGRALAASLVAASVAVGAVAVVETVRIGESGSRAAWTGSFTTGAGR